MLAELEICWVIVRIVFRKIKIMIVLEFIATGS